MNLPEKCRENTYIQYGNDGNPEYVVLCEKKGSRVSIQKVIPLKDNIDEIILPRVIADKPFMMPINVGQQNEALAYYEADRASNYAKGIVRIKNSCFEGMGDVKVVVPFRNSIVLENRAFDNNANIEFVLPSGMALKNVTREYGARYKGYDDWVVIADKELNGKIDFLSSYLPEVYSAKEFDPESMRFVKYSISKETLEERMFGKDYKKDEPKFETISMEEFGEYYSHEHDNQM